MEVRRRAVSKHHEAHLTIERHRRSDNLRGATCDRAPLRLLRRAVMEGGLERLHEVDFSDFAGHCNVVIMAFYRLFRIEGVAVGASVPG
jgi:hypothetical protein